MTLPPALEPAVRACRSHLRLAAGLSALINILYLAPTLYMMQVYDRAVPTGGVITLMWLSAVVGFALATLAALDGIRARVLLRAGMRLDNELSAIILDHGIGAKAGSNVGSQQAMREFDNLRQAFSGTPSIALFDLGWTPIYIIVAFLLHPALGAMSLVSAAILIGITIANERQNREATKAGLTAMMTAYVAQERTAQMADVIRALGMRRAIVGRQLAERRRGLHMVSEQQFSSGRYASLAKFFRLFLQSMALGLGALLAIENQISVGSIIAASVLLSRALQPIELIVASWKSLVEARQAIDALGGLLSDGGEARTGKFDLPSPAGTLSVEGIGFAINDQRTLLSDISFKVDAGEFIGIVGPSGAGKSTLVRILAGASTPSTGIVRIDGSDMQDWDAERLAKSIGYVPQEPALLPGTIAENIARFEPAAPDAPETISERVIKAATAAGAHDLIVALPGGYDRVVGWNGEGLSAGQRQRVALARAFFGDPVLLILDEPNAALDSAGEAALLESIQGARARGATVLMVAHRSQILAQATRLLVIVNGRIDLYGPRDAVISRLQERNAKPALAREQEKAA